MQELLQEIEKFTVTGIVADSISYLSENKKAHGNISYNLRYKLYSHGYSRFMVDPYLSIINNSLLITEKDHSVLIDIKDIEAINIRYAWIGHHKMDRYWMNTNQSEGK